MTYKSYTDEELAFLIKIGQLEAKAEPTPIKKATPTKNDEE